MGTLTPLNAKEFWQLADFVFFKTRSRGFAFDFVARVGNARGFEKALTPEEALALSERYLDMKQARYAQRPEFSFAEKPGLFRLLRVKRGDYAHYDDGETYPAAGCLIANNCLNVLSDGTMLACRRFPQIVGRLPQDDLEQILLRSPILKKYRRPQFWKACGNCMAWGYCRGCPAVSFGESGDPFAPLPYCYAHLLGFDAFRAHAPIPMETTDEEEAELIKCNLMQTYARGVAAGQINPDFSKQLLAFCADPEQERAFVRSPEAWFAAHRPEWEAADRRLFTARFNQFRAAESAPSVSG